MWPCGKAGYNHVFLGRLVVRHYKALLGSNKQHLKLGELSLQDNGGSVML
jgi:hypothetical protein